MGVKVVREAYGVITARHANSTIIVTSGVFTQGTRAFTAGKPIDLIEGHQLAELIHCVQINPSPASPAPQRPSPSAPKAAPIAPNPPLVAQPATPQKVCPKCRAPMVLRTAQ